MQSHEEIYNRLKVKKAERRDLKESVRNELEQNKRYQEILDQMAELRTEKKAIENDVMNQAIDRGKLDELAVDIKTDTELLSDVVLNKILANEACEIVDEMNVTWVPLFSVKFKKS